MALYGAAVENALHCLLILADDGIGPSPSARDLAEFQGISGSYTAKIFTKLEKAGLVCASEGVRGGFRLARPAAEISVLDVVEAVEGRKPLFECREIRADCVLFDGNVPRWATKGLCAVHAVMLEADKRMRQALSERSLADIATSFLSNAPSTFMQSSLTWLEDKAASRAASPSHSKSKVPNE